MRRDVKRKQLMGTDPCIAFILAAKGMASQFEVRELSFYCFIYVEGCDET